MVLHYEACRTACDVLVVLSLRYTYGAGVACVEVREVEVNVCAPVFRKVVTYLYIASILLESHVRTVIVRAAVLRCYGRVETTLPYLVGSLCLHGAVAACTEAHVGVYAVSLRLTCYDVHYSAHGVSAIQHGGRTAHNLYALSHQSLVAVRYRMTEKTLILRMSVNEHHGLTGTA